MKRVAKILFCFIVIYIILESIPVKRCISAEEADTMLNANNNVYICEFAATTGPSWSVGTKEETISELVCLEGNVPIDDINKAAFFWFSRNKFLIQGEAVGKRIVSSEGEIKDCYDVEECNRIVQNMEQKYECYDIINVTKWDIIGPIERGDSFRFFAPKNALSLFDFMG